MSRDGVPGNPGYGFLGQGVGDFYVLVNLRTCPHPTPSPHPVNPEKYRLTPFNPGVPTKPGVGFVGWKPGVDFSLFGVGGLSRRSPNVLLS